MTRRQFETVDDITAYYLRGIEQNGIDAPRTMGYHTGPIDDRLIKHLLPASVPANYSVLDVGCGLGQLIPILANRFPDAKLNHFVGLDLVDEFIVRCKQQFPQHAFITENFLDWQVQEKFDLVIAAGVLVTQIADYETYLGRCIRKMVIASNNWLAFNVVGAQGVTYTAKHLATISGATLKTVLDSFPDVTWHVQELEVFPGAKDVFVQGQLKK